MYPSYSPQLLVFVSHSTPSTTLDLRLNTHTFLSYICLSSTSTKLLRVYTLLSVYTFLICLSFYTFYACFNQRLSYLPLLVAFPVPALLITRSCRVQVAVNCWTAAVLFGFRGTVFVSLPFFRSFSLFRPFLIVCIEGEEENSQECMCFCVAYSRWATVFVAFVSSSTRSKLDSFRVSLYFNRRPFCFERSGAVS